MGQAIFAAIKENEEQNKAETKEKLQTLQRMLSNKVDAMSSKMELEATQDQRLPIVGVVDRTQKYSINVADVPADTINSAVGNMFAGKFLDGLKNLVTAVLNEFLGNTSAGEQETEQFAVVFSNNSLLRVDYMMYKYQFEFKGLKDEVQNGFCYFAQVGVLDLQKVNPQIVLYELTKSVGAENMSEVIQTLSEVSQFATQLYGVIEGLRHAASGSTGNRWMKTIEFNQTSGTMHRDREKPRTKRILTTKEIVMMVEDMGKLPKKDGATEKEQWQKEGTAENEQKKKDRELEKAKEKWQRDGRTEKEQQQKDGTTRKEQWRKDAGTMDNAEQRRKAEPKEQRRKDGTADNGQLPKGGTNDQTISKQLPNNFSRCAFPIQFDCPYRRHATSALDLLAFGLPALLSCPLTVDEMITTLLSNEQTKADILKRGSFCKHAEFRARKWLVGSNQNWVQRYSSLLPTLHCGSLISPFPYSLVQVWRVESLSNCKTRNSILDHADRHCRPLYFTDVKRKGYKSPGSLLMKADLNHNSNKMQKSTHFAWAREVCRRCMAVGRGNSF